MEQLLNRKFVISIFILFILSILTFYFLLSLKQFTNKNGNDNGKTPAIVIGANAAKEGIKKTVTYCFKQISSKEN